MADYLVLNLTPERVYEKVLQRSNDKLTRERWLAGFGHRGQDHVSDSCCNRRYVEGEKRDLLKEKVKEKVSEKVKDQQTVVELQEKLLKNTMSRYKR